MSAPHELFASCAPGLEPLLEAELGALGALDLDRTPGGVRFRGHRRVIYRVNLESGLATHVLVRVASFVARRFDTLEEQLGKIAWERYLTPGVPRRYRVVAKKSRLVHTGAIAERAANAIAKRLRDEATTDDAGVPVHLRFFRDRVQVSVDTSGAPLHRRGYRLDGGPAPLREDLARALVFASGWSTSTPLVDPLCGTGTIPIEAAFFAQQIAPGHLRSFSFEQTPLLDAPTWAEVREASSTAAREGPTILGRDRDPRAIAASRANAARAGVAARFEEASLSAPLEIDAEGGAIVTHPPFGLRMGGKRDLAPLYRALGAMVPDGWRFALLSADRKLGLRSGRDLRTAFLTDAGGVKVRALVSRSPVA